MGFTSRMTRIFTKKHGEGEWKAPDLSLRKLAFPLRDRMGRCSGSVEIMSSITGHRETLSGLASRQSSLESLKAEMERTVAEKLSAGDRLGALQALKRKKILDREIFQLDNARLRLESMIFSIESALTQQQTCGALNDLSGRYRTVVKQCNPDKVERLLEEVELNQSAQNRMAQLIQINNSSSEVMTDKELDTELMEYEIREFDRKVSVLENLPTGILSGIPTAIPTLAYEATAESSSSPLLITSNMSSPTYEIAEEEDYSSTSNRGLHMVS